MKDSQEQFAERESAPAPQLSPPSLITRQKEPKNLETPFDRLESFLTPTERFYVRSHFPAPELDLGAYRLSVAGAVRTPLSLTYWDLREMPSETQVATLECAGNSRIFLVPPAEGVQWELGAIGNAEWTGVPLRALLERAGMEDDVCEIVLEGADQGIPKEKPAPSGPVSYARSLSREKAMQPEVLIAYQMNGRDLPPDHGYPIRAIVPGHYGMASVKWLTHIHLLREPFQGYWQTADYGFWDSLNGMPVLRALGEMKVKSQIARPRAYETIAPNQLYTVFGAAWAGETEVAEVAVSTDAGHTWVNAEFLDPVGRYAWRRWKYDWLTPRKPGKCTLLARAKDVEGNVQPEEHDRNYGSYVINHSLPIEVTVGETTIETDDQRRS
jgi:DMSO/TMAO reductase YedYZ molybdopterin-dependent catalytic subunit